MKPRIRKYFSKFARETYVNDIEQNNDKRFYLDCSLGINPYGCSNMIVQNMKFDSKLITQYPKYSKERIIKFWSDIVKLDEVNIFFDAGTYGAIERINKLFVCEKSKVMGYCPQFTDYITDVRSCGGTYDFILLKPDANFRFDATEMLSKIGEQYNLIYLDNPNNPTGQIIPLNSIYYIAKRAEQYNIAVLVDESYGDYMDKTNSAISLINKLGNLFVARSFSKGYGLGGLRVGYVVLSTELSSYYSKVSHPFPANALGFYLAHIAMEDGDFLQESKRLIQITKNEIIKTCERLKVLETDLSVPIMTLGHPDKGVNLHEEFLNNNVITCSGRHFIGLGNIWMFSWRVGQYGGAAFLVPYFFFVFVLCSIGLMGEFAFGRSQKKGSIGAFEKVFKGRNLPFGAFIGAIPVLAQAGVLIFYAIVVGWIYKYFVLSLMGSFTTMDIGETFGKFAGQPESLIWHFIAMVSALIIVRLGVEKGIESANKIMMPGLFVLFIILAVRVLTLPGANEGIKYLFVPKWSFLLDPMTWIMALGQAFFSVCLGGASMVVYGSYIDDNVDIPSSAFNTAFFDTCAALLAAIVIIPACFAFKLDPTAGPPLLFITIPNILKVMPGGHLFGVLFFTSIVFAAVSSVINLMEVVVEAIMDRFKFDRNKSVLITAILAFLAGVPLAINMDRFGSFIDLVTVYFVPIGAVLAAITFFWIYGAENAREQVNVGAAKPLGKWFEPMGKYVFTGISILVIIMSFVYKGI